MAVTLLTCFLIISIVCLFIKRRNKRIPKLPNGPPGWPVVGNLPDLMNKPFHLELTRYAELYGPIYTISALGRPTVVLSNRESINEAMVTRSPDVDSKTNWRFCFMEMLKGISVLQYGPTWKNTRRRAVRILRDFGMGKIEMEKKIVKEGHILISNILQICNDGKTNVDVRRMIRRAPVNIITEILFKKRYDYGDNNEITLVLNSMENLLSDLQAMSLHDLLPEFLRPIAKYQLKGFRAELAFLDKFFSSIVNEHKQTHQSHVVRDFVDAWLQIAKEEDENELAEKRKISSPLKNVLQDLMFAGAHSSAYSLTWIVLFLTLNQEIQNQVYTEIQRVVGERPPTMKDRCELIFVEAVILESLRIATLVPVVGHACYVDTVVQGHALPRNTEVIYNNWSINFDEKVFPSAKSFLPNRWITKEGNIDKSLTAQFYPFGIGKRHCPGENLGKMELFLLTVIIFQNLETLMPDNEVEAEYFPAVEHVFNFVAEPKKYKIRIRKRFP